VWTEECAPAEDSPLTMQLMLFRQPNFVGMGTISYTAINGKQLDLSSMDRFPNCRTTAKVPGGCMSQAQSMLGGYGKE